MTLRTHLEALVHELLYPIQPLPTDPALAIEEASKRVKETPKPSSSTSAVFKINKKETVAATAAPSVTLSVDFHDPLDLARLKEAGVGLRRQELQWLSEQMLKFTKETENLEMIKFFGKFLGTTGDYYVVECIIKNSLRFFLITSGSADFVGLPLSSAAGISESRRVQFLLSGDWTRRMEKFGCEIDYLRCLVDRLRANRLIAEETPSEIEGLKYANPFFYRSGRTTLTDAEKEEGLEEVEEHQAASGEHFVFRKFAGDAVLVESKKFPGSYTFVQGGRCLSLYVGDGISRAKKIPVFMAGRMQDNAAESVEGPEPWPLEDDEAKPVEGE